MSKGPPDKENNIIHGIGNKIIVVTACSYLSMQ